jgi:hypothetical protein
LSRNLRQVSLIGYKLVQIDNLFVDQHTSDLADVLVTEGLLNARIDQVTDILLLLIQRVALGDAGNILS